MTRLDYSTGVPGPVGPAQAGGPAGAVLQDAWGDYVSSFAEWSAFYTLTFSEHGRTHDVTKPEAVFLWRRLVQVMNSNLYGNHYTRLVGHSYFAYALAFEFTSRNMLHMHALVSSRTHWELVNRLWRHMAGIVKIVPVSDRLKVSRYVCKYVTKGGDVLLYKPAPNLPEPAFKPAWFMQGTGILTAYPAE